jgi:hypothetical protein
MTTLQNALQIIQVILSIALIVVIILQARGQGLGSLFGNNVDVGPDGKPLRMYSTDADADSMTRQGLVTHEEAEKSFRLAATEVLPQLQDLEPLPHQGVAHDHCHHRHN